GQIFFDVLEFFGGRRADKNVPGRIVEFPAENVIVFAVFGWNLFLVFRSESEYRFHYGDVAGLNFATVDVVVFGAGIIAERVESADADGRIDSLDGLQERGL